MNEFIKKRPLFCVCLSGIFSAFICSFMESRAIFAFLCAVVFAIFFVLPLKFELKKAVILSLIFSALMSVSFFAYYKFTYEKACRLNSSIISANCTVLTESVSTASGNYSVDIYINSIDENELNLPEGCKLRLYYSQDKTFLPSARINAEIQVADTESNDKFDADGVHITGYATKITTDKEYDAKSFSYMCYKARNFVSNRIDSFNTETAAFVTGMILGDKSKMSGVFVNKFSDIGMSHVMAVSGMHLLFAVLFFDFLFAFFGMGYKLRCMFSALSVILFLILSGFAVSCIRSAIMVFILYAGKLTNKSSDSLTSLSFAAFLILLVTPFNVRSASFVLSASATLGIIVLTPIFNLSRCFSFKNYHADKVFRFVCTSVAVSLAANVACLPALIIMFKEVNLLSPLSNILLIFPIQTLFYLGFAQIVLSFIPVLSSVLSNTASYIYNLIKYITEWEYSFKFTSINAGYKYFYLVFALFGVLILGIFVYYFKFPKKKIYPYVYSYVIFCLILFAINFFNSRNTVKAEFVDVGQGSCTIFSKDESAVIIDCGGQYTDKLYESLKYSYVKNIELIALTHFDTDHVKYLLNLVNSYDIEKIIFPEFCDVKEISDVLEKAVTNGTEIISMAEDVTIDVLDGASVTVFLSRAYDVRRNDNTSALYKFEYCGSSVVCPGDMNYFQELVYVGYGSLLDCDILLAPHHGSSGNLIDTILDLYSPDYTVISCGKDNSYGHPSENLLKRVSAVSQVLRTDQMSTITFMLNSKGYELVK